MSIKKERESWVLKMNERDRYWRWKFQRAEATIIHWSSCPRRQRQVWAKAWKRLIPAMACPTTLRSPAMIRLPCFFLCQTRSNNFFLKPTYVFIERKIHQRRFYMTLTQLALLLNEIFNISPDIFYRSLQNIDPISPHWAWMGTY